MWFHIPESFRTNTFTRCAALIPVHCTFLHIPLHSCTFLYIAHSCTLHIPAHSCTLHIPAHCTFQHIAHSCTLHIPAHSCTLNIPTPAYPKICTSVNRQKNFEATFGFASQTAGKQFNYTVYKFTELFNLYFRL